MKCLPGILTSAESHELKLGQELAGAAGRSVLYLGASQTIKVSEEPRSKGTMAAPR